MPRLSDRGAGAIFIDPRLLRRVIKRHRRPPGLGLSVPRALSYVLSRDTLLSILAPDELGCPEGSVPAEVILLPRPALDDLEGVTPAEAQDKLWRSTPRSRLSQARSRSKSSPAFFWRASPRSGGSRSSPR